MHLRLGLYFLEQRAFIITAKSQDINQVIILRVKLKTYLEYLQIHNCLIFIFLKPYFLLMKLPEKFNTCHANCYFEYVQEPINNYPTETRA